MSEKLAVKNPIYPVISLASSVLILVFGLVTAKSESGFLFLCGVWLLLLVYGYRRSCFAVLPVAAVMCAILAGITYAISKDMNAALAAVNRIFAVCIAVIPGMAMPPVLLVRNMSALKLPRMLILGMMITFNFFPLLGDEVKKVREAMKTRGAGSFFSPQIFYRAFLIPLIMRIVNISDTLALSVETRGFSAGAEHSVYKTVKLCFRDIIFIVVLLIGAVAAVVI